MMKRFLIALLSLGLLFSTAIPGIAVTRREYREYHYRREQRRRYLRHRRHMRTAKRVGIGAAGGAVVGAIAGGGKGAGIGALAGGGAGYLYDRYKRHHR